MVICLSQSIDMDWHARYYEKHKDRIRLAAQQRRRVNVAATILSDCKRSDKKRGRENDLDLAFIQSKVDGPCSYCGDIEIRMTLDRIDNDKGHVRSNVVGACERCNYARRDMPYAAWLLIAKAMREARELGLFQGWTGGVHRRSALASVPLLPTREPSPHGTLGGYKKCGPPRCDACRAAMRDWKRDRRKSLGL